MVAGPAAARGYLDLGMDAIPLYPLSKRARLLSWQRTDPALQWESAGDQDNVGLRCAGDRGLCVIDSDDKTSPTWQNVQDYLFGFGLEPGSYPVVTTPHGGRHAYLSLVGSLDGDYRTLQRGFGAGEFRYGPGAMVAAPPSELPDGCYAQIDGDLRELPRILVQDILPILSNQVITAGRAKIERHPSRRATILLQGQGIDTYSTRSEAEQAIVTSLVNTGFDFPEILELFEVNPAAGKFRDLWNEKPESAIRWLKGSYEKALEFTSSNQTPAREKALSMINYARSIPWPGLTGSTDRAVLLAHLSIAYRAAKLVYSAGARELAELAGVDKKTAAKANHRLIDAGLLSLVTPAVATLASQYRLELHNGYTPYKNVRECTTHATTNHDVFRRIGLGKAAGEVYAALLEQPGLTIKELVARTGRNKTTIWRALVRMLKMVDTYTGECLPMVEKNGETWKALEVDLNLIAHIVGSAGIGRKQKELHQKERVAHRRGLKEGER